MGCEYRNIKKKKTGVYVWKDISFYIFIYE